MADQMMVKDEGVKFAPHPEGQFGAVCVDVLDLGYRVERFTGKPARLSYKLALVFQTDEVNEQNEPFTVNAEFTASMHERAALRAFLEAWRGKSYTEEQARGGVPVHKLEGVGALVSIEHKKSGSGRTYAKIKSVSPLPKAMPAPAMNGYQRPEFWQERKAKYAAEVAEFKRDTSATSHDDYPAAQEEGDDELLPF